MKLDIGSNSIEARPESIGNLQILKCGYNQISEIPPEIGNTPSMLELNLAGNGLTTLPKNIGNLVNLQKLYLLSNRLSKLPSEIGNLTNLQVLDLSWNQLTSLPRSVENMQSLGLLDLRENPGFLYNAEDGNTPGRAELMGIFGDRVVFE